jgi:hypothetical protein
VKNEEVKGKNISRDEVLFGAVGELPILQNKQSDKNETFPILITVVD